jgi:hypothetical protein
MLRQALDLLDIEDGIALEERDFALGLLAGRLVALAFLIRSA